MASTFMEQLRSAFHSVMNGERYSRFTLRPPPQREEEEGEGEGEGPRRSHTHTDAKLSNGAAGEGEGEGPDADVGSSYRPPPPPPPPSPTQRRQTLCFIALGTAILFVVGFLLGYASHARPHQAGEPVSCATQQDGDGGGRRSPAGAEEEEGPDAGTSSNRSLDWDDITRLLTDKLRPQAFEETLSVLDRPSRRAGSAEDAALADLVYGEFRKQDMEPWTDEHYVQLQTQDGARPNRVLIGSQVLEPKGYLAYSATGTVEGKVVYGNYGRPEDMAVLQKNKVELKGCVMVLRAGCLSFAQKVWNAAELQAAGVLIYPDPQDYGYQAQTELYGHVHLGSGDPYTPGFPSFNHTQFPPARSSGLPSIPAQTVTAQMAATILMQTGGPEADPASGFRGNMAGVAYSLGGVTNATLEVHNLLVNRAVHNVFGLIRGTVDPDRFVVLGAQRDAWGSGYARAAVGTALLLELAKAVRAMVTTDGFRPRRSLLFASWSAGEYGSVGATEWLEAYMSSIDRKAVTYISLDGAVMGLGSFKASASPLLFSLLESTMKQVSSPLLKGSSVYSVAGGAKWEADALTDVTEDDPVFPFLAFSGIPSVSFHFTNTNRDSYRYYGTVLDTRDHLDYLTAHGTPGVAALAARTAGLMALRLAHDRVLPLDVRRYGKTLTRAVQRVYRGLMRLRQSALSPSWLSAAPSWLSGAPSWLSGARGSFQRAADDLMTSVTNADLSDPETCRLLNDRIMTVEHSLLSPYVSPRETPFRHLLFGHGPHTLAAIASQTQAAAQTTTADHLGQLRTQLALATWTLQGCANAMGGAIWDLHGH